MAVRLLSNDRRRRRRGMKRELLLRSSSPLSRGKAPSSPRSPDRRQADRQRLGTAGRILRLIIDAEATIVARLPDLPLIDVFHFDRSPPRRRRPWWPLWAVEIDRFCLPKSLTKGDVYLLSAFEERIYMT